MKIGDRVEIVGHPYIKEGTKGILTWTYETNDVNKSIENASFYQVKLTGNIINVNKSFVKLLPPEIEIKQYLTCNTNDKELEKEVKVYNYMRSWRDVNDDVELDFKNKNISKWGIYFKNYSNKRYAIYSNTMGKKNIKYLLLNQRKSDRMPTMARRTRSDLSWKNMT